MAEFIFKDLVAKAGLNSKFKIASAAVSAEEEGNPVYPPAQKQLLAHGLDGSGKRARCLNLTDLQDWDLILVMDHSNLSYLTARFGPLPDKVKLLYAFSSTPDFEVDDPWYSHDFKRAYQEIAQGCQQLLAVLQGKI